MNNIYTWKGIRNLISWKQSASPYIHLLSQDNETVTNPKKIVKIFNDYFKVRLHSAIFSCACNAICCIACAWKNCTVSHRCFLHAKQQNIVKNCCCNVQQNRIDSILLHIAATFFMCCMIEFVNIAQCSHLLQHFSCSKCASANENN